MSEFSWGLMGYNPQKPNNIGLEITRQIGGAHERLQLESAPRFIMRRGGIFLEDGITPHEDGSFGDLEEFPDVVFVALTSTLDGEPATSRILESLERGATVITCEKGALSNNFKLIKDASDDLARIGFNAAFGGGTKPMEKNKPDLRDPHNIQAIHMKPGASIEFVRRAIASGVPRKKAMRMAIDRGMAEPGAKDMISFIRTEIDDTRMKTVIYANQSGLLASEDFITVEDLAVDLSDAQIEDALGNPDKNHFISSIYPTGRKTEPQPPRKGGWDRERGLWRLVGGYTDPEGIESMEPLVSLDEGRICLVTALGPPNAADGIYPISGPGAGPAPTVNAMLDDFIHKVRDKSDGR